jgi:hypothetical protein
MKGDTDTANYVQLVNTKLLSRIKANYPKIKWEGNDYYIDNISDLNSICVDMEDRAEGSEFDSALLYPYFYSAYLYQPSVKDGETLDSQYEKHKWYAPSVGELSRIIYYRGYSSAGSEFIANNCRGEINKIATSGSSSGIPVGNTPETTPIFSMALSSMDNDFPNVWKNIVGAGDNGTVNNITTTVYSFEEKGDNYSY